MGELIATKRNLLNITNLCMTEQQNAKRSDEIKFCSNGELTLGVEIELQLIDPQTLNLKSCAEKILNAAKPLTNKVKKEFYLSTIEVNTDKCENLFEVEKDLTASFDLMEKIAKDVDCKFATTGCHAFSRYADCIITQSQRYQQLVDRNQWLARRMTVYGLHVHLGMKSGDDAIRFNNFFLNFIPHLLAISASSPFWQGEDTGLASCRPTTYESLPTAGTPYFVKNWQEFEGLYDKLRNCKAINSVKDLWWDLRPSPHYGTLEIRACDGLATLDGALSVVALIHLLANWFNDNASWLNQMPITPAWMLRENKWHAIRHGLSADLVTNVEGNYKLISDDIIEWLDKLKPYEQKLGYKKYIDLLYKIIEKGNSSVRQRKIFANNNSLQEVMQFNVAEFANRSPIWR